LIQEYLLVGSYRFMGIQLYRLGFGLLDLGFSFFHFSVLKLTA
jgi:hypothetical protein